MDIYHFYVIFFYLKLFSQKVIKIKECKFFKLFLTFLKFLKKIKFFDNE